VSNVLPQGWEEKELSEVIITQKGFAFKSKDYQEKGRQIVKVSNFTDNSIDTSECICIDELLVNEYDKYLLKTNDILIATVGSWPGSLSVVAKVVKVPLSANNTLLNQNAVNLKSLGNINKKYLYYLLKDYHFRKYIEGSARGSANQASITLDAIKKYNFITPKDINEQKRIADILSAFDDKIELNNQMNQTLEDMATTLFKEWFENFNFPNEQGKPYKDNDGKMKSSELGEIPIDWNVKQLVKITSKIGDGLHGTPKYTEEGEYFFINGNNLVNGIIELGQNTKRANIEEYEKYKKVLNKNTILLSINGTLGNIAFYNEEKVFLSKSVCYINGLEDYYKVFIVCLFKSNYFKQYLYNYANGTTIKNLSLKSIRELNFSINKNICKQFSNIVNPIFEQIQQNQQQNQTLKQQRDTLLPKLMSGEIRV
jgi:type I restriction enzyme, S subunit